MIDNRTIAIVMELFATKAMSLYELSIQTGVDKKDLLTNLQQVNELLQDKGFERIAFEDGIYQVPEALLHRQQELFEWLKSREIYLTQEERQFLIYLYTFIRKDFISNNHYQDLLGVSRNTTLADIKVVRELCEQFGVGFEYTRSQGYHLTGREEDKHRLAIYAISACLNSAIGVWALDYLLRSWGEKNQMTTLKQVSQQVIRFYQLSTLEDRFDEYLYFLQYLSVRKRRVQDDIVEVSLIAEESTKELLLQLWKVCSDGLHLPNYWVDYLANLLQGCLEGEISEKDKFYQLTLAIVEEMERLSLIEFTHQTDLIEGLKRHLIPAYARLTSNLVTVNAYTDVIKEEHKDLFEIVKKALRPLEKVLGFEVPDSEVSYFVVHFGGYLEAVQDRQFRYRALVVCPNGVSSSLIIKENLKQLFPNIYFAETHSLAEVEEVDQTAYDMVFSTIKLETSCPFFLVPLVMTPIQKRELFHLVNEQFVNAGYIPIEIEQLLSVINKHATIHHEQALKYELVQFLNEKSYKRKERSPMLDELITKDTYQYSDKKISWKEAIALAAQPLIATEAIEERYIDAMISKVEDFGPFIDLGKGVAIPHARPEDGVNHVGMSMLRLEQPVCLLDDPKHEIQLFICIAAVDNQTHLKALSHLTAILRESKNIQQLVDSKEFSDIADLLKEEK